MSNFNYDEIRTQENVDEHELVQIFKDLNDLEKDHEEVEYMDEETRRMLDEF